MKLTESFYKLYQRIYLDTLKAFFNAIPEMTTTSDGLKMLAMKTQKFLHRGIMVCFMADHPLRLIPKDSLKKVIDAAKFYPAISEYKIFPAIQSFFSCVDSGSPHDYLITIYGYDGGLFANDPILDNPNTKLPDELFERDYMFNDKQLAGIFGFHALNFYQELSPHLLGRLFEFSVGDQEAILRKLSQGVSIDNIQDIRGELGIIYTREVLANFAAESVLESTFKRFKEKSISEINKDLTMEAVSTLNEKELLDFWALYFEKLLNIRIIDLAVGSGAFLVECYKILSKEIEKALEMSKSRITSVDKYLTEEKILTECIFGKDILSEAISTSKLSLWLSSAKKDSRLPNFSNNFIIGDSLDVPLKYGRKLDEINSHQQFDIVIGNPPWGASVEASAIPYLKENYGELNIEDLDSFELFLYVAMNHVREEGSLCFILPHSLLYSEKKKTRKFLFDNFTIEKWHYLGSDWFGREIRMNTTMLQLIKNSPNPENTFESMTLVDNDRKQAIKGEINLRQFEELYSFKIPQARSIVNPTCEVELFRYINDDVIMSKMYNNSLELNVLCDRGRGVEMNKRGEIYQCPGCFKWDVPPKKKKNEIYEEQVKNCSHCGHEYQLKKALSQAIIIQEKPFENNTTYYIDGDSFEGRYNDLTYRFIELNYNGINYKEPELYTVKHAPTQ